ncbi:hypothetical protein E4U40_001251 [Claviceps sp. LM458 group G5]|nr:hypothetical protein E4U40_001251 [Claviceps sp. LM458 group G5]
MPPSKDPPPPLPLAPDRAALSNKIALLLSQRTSLLKSLAPSNTPQNGTSESTTRAATATSRRPLDNDEDLLATAARPNDGVGYVRPAEGASPSLEDTKLRGRMMLGKRKKGSAGAAMTSQRRIYESESESDEGRGSLGRAKRARVKTSVEGPGKMEGFEKDCFAVISGMAKREHDGETKEVFEGTASAPAPAVEVKVEVEVEVEVEVPKVEAEAEAEGMEHEASKRQRKNQNKKRRKKEKKKGDGKAGEAPSGE